MDDLAKLSHSIEHWMEHNEGHRDTYLDWAKRSRAMGREDIAVVLQEIATETDRLQGLFHKALHLTGGHEHEHGHAHEHEDKHKH